MDRQQLNSEAGGRSQGTGSLLSPLPRRRWLPLLLAASLLFSAGGCQIVIGVLMILRGFPKEDSDFRKSTHRNMEDKSKKVVVLCSSPEKAKQEHVAIDQDMMAEVSRQMKANGLKVIEPHDILSWIDDHGGELRESDMLEISRKFDVDFVVQIQLDQFSIRDPASPGLYRGNVDAKILGWARDEQAAKQAKDKAKADNKPNDWTPPPLRHIYTKSYKCTYPIHQPVPADHESPAIFCKRFQTRVGLEIAQLFYDHRLEDEL